MKHTTKAEDSRQINFRFEKVLFDRVKEMARQEDRSVSYVIKRIIKNHLEKVESQHVH